MAGHTPGPWETRVPSNDQHALDVYAPDGRLMHRGYWGGEADARLIAAAPDLLEACRLALMDIAGDPDERERRRDVVRAAIAKAEGR